MRERLNVSMRVETVIRLRRYARRKRMPVSHVVEMAIEEYLDQRMPEVGRIVSTPGRFAGTFSRQETYKDL